MRVNVIIVNVEGDTQMTAIVSPLATPPKFPLGQVVITANANTQLAGDAVQHALRRHAAGDWGDVCPADAKENELSLKEGFRLFSVYHDNGKRFWVITECDRSVTTVLLPEDY
jgi:hypothetical protein